jgi:hypothetical protein
MQTTSNNGNNNDQTRPIIMATTVRLPSSAEEVDTDAVDRLLAGEMDKLSIVERYRVKLDIEGRNVLAAVEPAALSNLGLDALEHELSIMTDKPYYDMAISLNSPMIVQRKWKLKFARAERFDPTKAAIRIEKHLKFMYQHFGKDALLRPIRLSDLDKVRLYFLFVLVFVCAFCLI